MQVLLTCAGGLQGLTLIKELRELPEISIHVCNSGEESIGKYFSDHYCLAPHVADGDRYTSFLEEYIYKNSIGLVIPATPYDLELLAACKHRFKEGLGCDVAVSDSGLLEILLNKRSCLTWLKCHGLPTFDVLDPGRLEDSLPAFGRPLRGWGGKGAVKLLDACDIPLPDVTQQYVWTSYVDNYSEYSVDFCIDFDGVSSQPVIRQRKATVGGFAVVMDSSCVPVSVEQSINDLITAITREGGLGIFNVQIIQDEIGKWRFSDINPRVGTSAVLAAKLGHNLCGHLLNRRKRAASVNSNRIKVVRYLQEFVIDHYDLGGVKGVVFDLDDTLISHKAWINDKVRAVAVKFAPEREKEFLFKAAQIIDEGRAWSLYDSLCPSFGLEELKDDMILAHRQHCPTSAFEYEDVLPVLERLSSRYRLGLLSDNPAVSQRQKLAVFPKQDIFQSIVLTDEIGESKPHCGVFEAVADGMGLKANELVIVGDNYHRDIVGAVQANFAHGFLVRRPDRMFNTQVPPGQNPDRVSVISGLRELYWYL